MKYPPIPDRHVKRAARLVHELAKLHWPREAIAGFLAAETAHGYLRESSPEWMDKAVDFLLDHGRIALDESFENALAFVADPPPATRKNGTASS